MRIFNIVSLVVASLTILGTSTIGSVAAPQTAKGKRKATGNGKVIAYLPDWTLGDSYSVSNIPWNKTDHINYAFGSVVSATVVNGFDSSKLKQVVEAAHNNKVTVSLSVGGWSGGKEFSNIAKTASGRTNFVKTLVALVDNFGLDGLDMDWEFPASKDGMICNSVDPADSKNFVALLSQLRTALPSKILSVAAPLSPFNGPNYAPSNSVADYAAIPDMYVHLMAYDVN
ncbi:glycoside hydrolase superfamily, partial [Jimgerdemannia flammicorona]